ncbi:hypothetical protein [Leptodesmis sichuanensis]|uniref:hypothetical protein n=1 Tax=Leptodesmis sichuanensis TaxID=2906798 RepID=UPI001F22FD32|nr:hypothetical protein [Leptodesmis sichuanensis]UIE38889.1 hypothetical protein KIK02_04555 [Leptodesmis sichuanensis A121]
MSDRTPRRDYLTRFQQQGEVAMAKSPLSVRMPEDIDAIVRAKSDRTEWLRDAIFEKLWHEGNLPERYHHLVSSD